MRLQKRHWRQRAVDRLARRFAHHMAARHAPSEDRADALADARAVSIRTPHVGVSTRRASSRPIRSTGMSPRAGRARRSSVCHQDRTCLPFRQRGRFASSVRFVASRNMGTAALRLVPFGKRVARPAATAVRLAPGEPGGEQGSRAALAAVPADRDSPHPRPRTAAAHARVQNLPRRRTGCGRFPSGSAELHPAGRGGKMPERARAPD